MAFCVFVNGNRSQRELTANFAQLPQGLRAGRAELGVLESDWRKGLKVLLEIIS